ncbi:HNH endonuclease [Bacillus cereus group sp. BfR-BA-01323]|uniref:HNH endonuclease n=2 Tax=unclassified Bacillus cereus group TaxID=2750818 RepID=UPI001F59EC0B|nr:HNH endonuclease [Bacillus cereus]
MRRCLVCDAIKKSFSMEYKNMCSDCEIERERKRENEKEYLNCRGCYNLVERLNHYGYCEACEGDEICFKCYTPVAEVNGEGYCKECVNEELVRDSEVKDTVLSKIIYIVGEIDICEVKGFEYMDFSEETESTLRGYSIDTLRGLRDALEDLYYERMEMIEEEKEQYINPLEILNKYKDGIDKINENEHVPNETWRKHIPSIIKENIPSWQQETMASTYEKSKELMGNFRGRDLQVVREFVCELSEIIYDNEFEEEEEEVYQPDDEVAAAIMSLVEMIILPHLEVLDRLEKHAGKIIYGDLWNVPFKESLKIEVKDRDGWKCVICECETDLHVHHKIPRRLGGIHHKDNLVTLCASCHKAVEAANVKEAFKTCLANYKKMKFSGRKRQEHSRDKTLLKSEVENSLDKLVATLNNKDENELVEELLVVMEKLEIIFYD